MKHVCETILFEVCGVSATAATYLATASEASQGGENRDVGTAKGATEDEVIFVNGVVVTHVVVCRGS